MRYFSLYGWLLPAAVGLLLAGCQRQASPKTAAVGAPAVLGDATNTASVAAPADGITAALIGQHTQVLASDAFQDRRPFTAGEEKATGYLVAEFKKLALQPGPGGSYLQSVPLVEITGTPAPTATAVGNGKTTT